LRSFLHPAGKDIRVHTAIEAMMWALEKFFLSMLDVNVVAGQHPAWPARRRDGRLHPIPPRTITSLT